MEDISFPLAMIAFTAILAVQLFLPRAPTALQVFLALLSIGLGVAALFWPIRVPVSHELLVAFRLVAVISVMALAAVAMIRIMSRAITDGKAQGS